MIKRIAVLMFIGTFVLLQGCYDDYKEDFEYTTTYFPRQFPLRTLVDADGEDLKFEVGVVLGGKYSNDTNEEVGFIVEDTLLDAYPELTKLPDNYYSMNASSFTIPSGKFKGSVPVTLDKDLFMNDALAVGNNYALPLQLVTTTTDSILQDRHYTILVLKYFNKYHGWYYVKGTDTNTQDNSVETYSETDLVENEDMLLQTIAKDSLAVPYAGNPDVSGRGMKMQISENGNVVLSDGSGNISSLSGTGTYDSSTRNFVLQYNYTDENGAVHAVEEELIYRNTELNLEEWQ
ncbi:DUF1735 domain-containing protein [Seonamhaeicola marinus]|uniref:DUF1735 domain-containing protein n=1 Tax=Seonamhaeicola marinus TaxID=1912246 RepID=A0A5D0IN97_9FLAO|nr:DUF1735 domain-containing protein [Seonamhaeicola marinus]TYA84340.1 DUF1735 domain-containing protein [Seonamhaeicola marinus]